MYELDKVKCRECGEVKYCHWEVDPYALLIDGIEKSGWFCDECYDKLIDKAVEEMPGCEIPEDSGND